MSDNSSTATETEPKNEKKCFFCGNIAAKQSCFVCKILHYCSRAHKISDDSSHSKKNFLLKPDDHPILGNYTATKDIEAGGILLIEEKPLLTLPTIGEGASCLNCYVPLTLKNTKDCDHCGWPLCLECTRHGDECELTMKYRKHRVKVHNSEDELDPIYDAMLVMRAIAMRKKDPKSYEKLMSLEDRWNKAWTQPHAMNPAPKDIAVRIKVLMEIRDITEEEIAKIIGIVLTNLYQAKTPSGNIYIAIYEKASCISHSCRPNCSKVIRNDIEYDGQILVRAVRRISKGDPITISYIDPFYDTKRRREFLRKTRFFDCACERCSDPTEFGTMFNAIKCFTDNCNGYMLPPTFLVSAEENIPDYVCNTCEAKRFSKEVDGMLDGIYKILSNIDSQDVSELKKFISENSPMFLHENNFLILSAKLKLATPFESHLSDMDNASEECLQENINFCKKLDVLLEKLMPGEIEQRGRVLCTEFANMSRLHDKRVNQNLSESDSWSKEYKDVLSQIYKLLRDESEISWNGQLAKWARNKCLGNWKDI